MDDMKNIAAAGSCRRFTVWFCLLLLLQGGCAAVRPRQQVPPELPPTRPTVSVPPDRPAVPEPPAEYKATTGRATGIYNEAEEALRAGQYAHAEMLLERALRIEPRNPHYWYTLGMAKYRQKQYPQAVQFCLKAESLAASQPGLLARSRELLNQAKKASGAP
jgi:tetratricopeptide (TPR) repeat protein